MISFKKINLTKPIKLKNNFDIIYNFAAILGVRNVSKKPYTTLTQNIEITKNLIDFCKKKKNCKYINFSSSEVYSNLISKKLIKYPTIEKLDLIFLHKNIARDSYGLSKFISEKMCEHSNINFINIRPHNIYGPDMGYSHVIPELIKKMLNNKKISIVSANHKRAFCYIDDAVEQIIKLSFSKLIKKETFNIGNPNEEITIFNLAKKIQYNLKREISLKKDKKITVGSPERRVPSLSKFKKYFGKTEFTILNEGLRKTITWYCSDLKKNRKV